MWLSSGSEVKWLVKLCDCGSFLYWFLEGDPQVGTRGRVLYIHKRNPNPSLSTLYDWLICYKDMYKGLRHPYVILCCCGNTGRRPASYLEHQLQLPLFTTKKSSLISIAVKELDNLDKI